MSGIADFAPGDTVHILVYRSGVIPLSPGDKATVTATGLRNGTEPYVDVTVKLRWGTVYTSFPPSELERR